MMPSFATLPRGVFFLVMRLEAIASRLEAVLEAGFGYVCPGEGWRELRDEGAPHAAASRRVA